METEIGVNYIGKLSKAMSYIHAKACLHVLDAVLEGSL
jgi:hypothetical protein